MAWSWLQSVSASAVAATVTTAAVTSNLSSGSKLIAVVAFGDTASGGTAAVQDSNSNSFAKLVEVSGTTGGAFTYTALFVLDTPAGDAGTKPTFKATITGGTSPSLSILVQEVSGLATGNTTAILDGTAGTIQSSGTGTFNTTLPSYASNASNEYLVNIFGDQGAGATCTAFPSPGYTGDTHGVNGSTDADVQIYYKNSTGGTEVGTYTVGSTDAYVIILVAFKLPSSGVGPSLNQGLLPNFPAVITSAAGWRGAGHSR